jgi:hypothetical protein
MNGTLIEGFVFAVIYMSLLRSSPRPLLVERVSKKNGEANLKRFLERRIYNYFILGSLTTIKMVLDNADANGLFDSDLAWYVITAVSSDLYQY